MTRGMSSNVNLSCSHCNITNIEWCNNFNSFYGFTKTYCNDNETCLDQICEAALLCESYERSDSTTSDTNSTEVHCPRLFDGWACINATKVGESAQFHCPPFYDHNPNHKAWRDCGLNGEWWDKEKNSSFSHYEQCPKDYHVMKWHFWFSESLNVLYVTGYAISLAFLALATFTFLYFRSLRCVRNKIHTNLFISLIFNNLSWISWYIFLWYDWKQFLDENKDWPEALVVGCRILHFFREFSMATTYMWMLCEGLNLFVCVTLTFFSEQSMLKILYAIGWGLPLTLVIIYVIWRAAIENSYKVLQSAEVKMAESCWIDDHPTLNYIYKGPCILSVIVNIIFLVVIVMKLVTMLNSDSSDRTAKIKTTKAIAVLIPLFGLHFIISAFVPTTSYTPFGVKSVFDSIQAVTTSFQGMVVAILFCFMNSEVIGQLKRFLNLSMGSGNQHRQSIAMTQYTYVRPGPSVSVVSTGNETEANETKI